jgi:hypothetical protein
LKTKQDKPVQESRKPAANKAWSEKTAGKEKKGERREKRKKIKDQLRREREAEREKELLSMEGELEEDWKELRRERKRAKLDKGKAVKANDGIVNDVEFDL